MEQFVSAIRNKQLQLLYIIQGNDDYLLRYAKHLLCNSIVSKEEQAMNVSIYNMLDTDLSVAIEDADSFSFFSDQKVVILDNAYFLSAEKVKGIEQNSDLLQKYIDSPNPNTLLAIIVPTKLDKRKAIVKKLLTQACSVDVFPPNEKTLKQFIMNYIAEQGFTIEKQAYDNIVARTNAKLSIMMQEIDKLLLLAMQTKKINVSLVEQSVVKSLESNVFVLTESIEKKRLDDALQQLNDLLLQGEEPIKLLAILLSQYRLNIQVLLLKENGYQSSDIAKYLNQHPYRVQQSLKQIHQYSLKELKLIYNELVQSDFMLKTSQMNKQLVMELAIIKIIRGFYK